MKVKDLIEYLQKFNPDLEVWHSDGGYCEGSTRSIEPIVILAWNAELDGDEVDGEYCYSNDKNFIVDGCEEKGYFPTDNGEVYSKYIVLLRSQLDGR